MVKLGGITSLGKLSRQVGAKEPLRQKFAKEKAQVEFQKKEKELESSYEKLKGKSLSEYESSYNKIPTWQQSYFTSPTQIKAQQQTQVSNVKKEIDKEIAIAEQTLAARKATYQKAISDAQKRGNQTAARSYEKSLSEQDRYWNTYINKLNYSKGQVTISNLLTVPSIKDYASSSADIGVSRLTAKQQGTPEYTYTSPGGVYKMSMKKEDALKLIQKEGGTYVSEGMKWEAKEIAKPSYVSTTPFGTDYFDLTKPGGFEAYGKAYGKPVEPPKEPVIKRAKDWLGEAVYGSRIIAGSNWIKPQEFKDFQAQQNVTSDFLGLESKNLTGSEYRKEFWGIAYKKGYEEPIKEFPQIKKGYTLIGATSYFTGAPLLFGTAVSNIPKIMEFGKASTLSAGRQKELNKAIEDFNIKQSDFETKWLGTTDAISGEFKGTEEQFKSYSKDFNLIQKQSEDIKKLEGELKTRKASKKELGLELGISFATAGLFSAAFAGGSWGLKKGGTWLVGKSPKWLGKSLTYAGKGAEKGVTFYFGSKFLGEGIDIAGSYYTKDYEIAKLKTAGLVGGIAGFTAGSRLATGGLDKVSDIWRRKGATKISLAEDTTKPFWKESEGKYVFMKRHKGFKLREPGSWLRSLGIKKASTGKKFEKGSFIERQYRIINPKAKASVQGKKQLSYWEIDHKTKKIKWVTEKVDKFPFDKPSQHETWFKKWGTEEYGLTGLPKEFKGKAFGLSATGEAWKGSEFSKQPFKFDGKEIQLAAYQFYSGRGASPHFFRLGERYSVNLGGSLFGEQTSPTLYAGFFGKVKGKGRAIKEVKGVQGGRDVKYFLFKDRTNLGDLRLPKLKKEVEGVTEFTERFVLPEKSYFNLGGRSIILEKQTFGTGIPGASTKNIGGINIKSSPILQPSYPTSSPVKIQLMGFGSYPKTSYQPSTSSYLKSSYKPSSYLKSSYKPSSYLRSSYKPSSYLGSSYKPSSYLRSSYKPTSYKPTSYKPSSYLGSSYKPSRYRTPPYRPGRYRRTPPKTPTIIRLPKLPKLGGTSTLFKGRAGKKAPTRRASLFALGEGIFSTKPYKAEFSGLGIRPIILKPTKTKRRRKKKK